MVIHKYLAETLGTFMLVFIGSLVIVSSGGDLTRIALGFGLALLAGMYAVGDVSGGHLNPAVTLAMWLDRRTDTSDLAGYWIGQVVGALLGSIGLLIVADRAAVAGTATTHPALSAGEAFIIEALLSALFVLVALTATVRAVASASIAIPLAYTVVHLAAFPLTGASVNPARTLGPAIIGATGDGLWIYLLAPLVGGALGWLLYRMFHTQPGAA